jgi:hypothetical protein
MREKEKRVRGRVLLCKAMGGKRKKSSPGNHGTAEVTGEMGVGRERREEMER